MESNDCIIEEQKSQVNFLDDSHQLIAETQQVYDERIAPIIIDMKDIHSHIASDMKIGGQFAKINRTRMAVTILQIEISKEYRAIGSAKTLQEIHERKAKAQIRLDLEKKKIIGKAPPIGDSVTNKYWKGIDYTVYSMIEVRFRYLDECVKELERIDRALEQLAISYATARKDGYK